MKLKRGSRHMRYVAARHTAPVIGSDVGAGTSAPPFHYQRLSAAPGRGVTSVTFSVANQTGAFLPQRRCKSTTRRGRKCRMPPLRESKWCYAHHPKKARARAVARKRGGRNRRRTGADPPDSVSLASADDARQILERATMDCLMLDNSVKRACALSGLVRVALSTIEIGSFEARLEALESYISSTRAI